MAVIDILIIVIFLCCFSIFFGAPYLPTLHPQVITALDLLDLKPDQLLLELGSGDGRVVLAAAKRGYRVVGIEINPLLVIISRILTWRYRKKVKIIWGSYWLVKWPPAAGVFAFMISRHMPELDRRLTKWSNKPLSLVSFAFQVPGKKAIKQKNGIFLYQYK